MDLCNSAVSVTKNKTNNLENSYLKIIIPMIHTYFDLIISHMNVTNKPSDRQYLPPYRIQ